MPGQFSDVRQFHDFHASWILCPIANWSLLACACQCQRVSFSSFPDASFAPSPPTLVSAHEVVERLFRVLFVLGTRKAAVYQLYISCISAVSCSLAHLAHREVNDYGPHERMTRCDGTRRQWRLQGGPPRDGTIGDSGEYRCVMIDDVSNLQVSTSHDLISEDLVEDFVDLCRSSRDCKISTYFFLLFNLKFTKIPYPYQVVQAQDKLRGARRGMFVRVNFTWRGKTCDVTRTLVEHIRTHWNILEHIIMSWKILKWWNGR